jgi:glycosyltransferase involved in cell wall biosynthesis
VIPVYNGKRYIEEAIKSVVNQTLPTYEIIVVDDGSTDDSALILEELSTKYPIKLFRKANGGQSSARNYGVQVCSGDLIAFLDQDDVWYPNHLEELLEPYLEKHNPEIGWVYSNADQIGPRGELISKDFLKDLPATHPKTSISQCLTGDMLVLPSATLVSKKAFNEVGGFDERLCGYEDDDLFLRIFHQGYANIFINKALLQWRHHDTRCSLSNKFIISRIIYAKKFLEKYQHDHSIDFKCKNDLLYRFINVIFAEHNRGVANKDKKLTKLTYEHLHELFRYMDYKSVYKFKCRLFLLKHQFLKALCRPFYKI